MSDNKPLDRNNAFFLEVMSYLIKEGFEDMVFYRERDGTFDCAVNCSDLFWWATADAEEITPGNFGLLKQSVDDCRKVHDSLWAYGLNLFACRVRGLRPQGPAYPEDKELWTLFDAAGPERPIDMGNPATSEQYLEKKLERRRVDRDKDAEIKRLRAEVAELQKGRAK